MEKIVYEYCIVRYVPDLEREEFINIGLMMMCKRMRWMRCEIVINEPRINALLYRSNCPYDSAQSANESIVTSSPLIAAAVNRLRIQSALFTRPDVPAAGLPVEERYRWLAAVKSAILQTSPSHPGILLTNSSSRSEAVSLLDSKFAELLRRLIL